MAQPTRSLRQDDSWRIVHDGQELANAVAAWGASNQDATYTIPARTIVALYNSTFAAVPAAAAGAAAPFSNGTLNIQGARSWDVMSSNATASSVLDAGMRAGLTPSLVTRP